MSLEQRFMELWRPKYHPTDIKYIHLWGNCHRINVYAEDKKCGGYYVRESYFVRFDAKRNRIISTNPPLESIVESEKDQQVYSS